MPEVKKNLLEKKIKFLVKLKLKIGDRKIDVVLARNADGFLKEKPLKKE